MDLVDRPLPPFRVVLAGGDAALLRACAAALAPLATVVPADAPDRPRRPDLLLLVVSTPPGEALRAFVRLRRAQPEVPVVLLSAVLSANQAVELTSPRHRHRALDFLSLPLDPRVLVRRAERILLGGCDPTLAEPLADPIFGLLGLPPGLAGAHDEDGDDGDLDPAGPNRRLCFRAPLPSQVGLVVSFSHQGSDVQLVAEDLSVPAEGRAGGMRLRGDLSLAPQLPGVGTEVPAIFHVLGEPWPLRGRLRLVHSGITPTHVWLGVQYYLNSRAYEETMQRLWVRCQRGQAA